jgi:hypothetical protein
MLFGKIIVERARRRERQDKNRIHELNEAKNLI